MKAIILARVSTEEQKLEWGSIPAQLRISREYAERKELNIVNEYQFDESSTKDQRKKFEIVINEIKASKEPIALIVETVDRLQRSFKESVMLDELIKNWKLVLHFIRENLVIHKNSNSSEIQRWDLAVFVAKSYVLQLGDNVKRTNSDKRKKWEWTGPAPLWYLNTTLENGIKDIILDPERYWIIARIFEMYATGNYSMNAIVDWAKKEAKLKSRKGFILWKSAIEHILHNPFYCGIAYSKKYNSLIPHKYPKITTTERFEKCQSACSDKRVKPIKSLSKNFIFKGICTCDKCGCSVSPEIHTKKSGKSFIYYSCTNGKHNCKKDYVPESVFLEPIMEILGKLKKINPETLELILRELKKSAEQNKSFEQLQVQSIRQEISEAEKWIDALIETLASSNVSSITRERCDKKIQSLNDEITTLKQKLSQYSGSTKNSEIWLDTIISLAKRAKEIFESSEVDEKRMIVSYLVQNSKVRDRKPLFNLRSPYDTLLKVSERPNWLPG